MKLKKNIAAASLSVVMAAYALPLNVFAEENAETEAERIKVMTGTFTTPYIESDRFFYSDDYFAASGKEKNEHLRTMSMCVALTAMTTEVPEDTHTMLSTVGFEDFTDYDFNMDPTKETVGTVISHKDIDDDTTVISVAIRGSEYKDEVANMVDAGTEGDIKGFSEAAGKVIDRIKEYEKTTGTSGAKLWITGYSRSAAIADLAGKYINQHLDEFGITEDDLYDYPFEAPAASATADGYANIHDVKYPFDVVPMVYPAVWGLSTAGVDEIIGDTEEVKTVQEKVINLFGFKIEDRTVGKDPAEPITLQEADTRLLKLLTDNISRETFAANGEAIGNLTNMFLNMSSEQRTAIGEFAKSAFDGVDYMTLLPLIAPLLSNPKGSEDFIAGVNSIAAYVIGLFDAKDHSACLSDVEYNYIKACLPSLLQMLAPVIITDISNPDGIFLNIATFAGNIKALTYDQHYPPIIFEILKQEDSYYTGKNEIARGNAAYYTVEITDEMLYDDDALLKVGFTAEDIEYLKNGFDVTYDIELAEHISYYSCEDTAVKNAVEAYIKDNNLKLKDALVSNMKAYKKTGYSPAEYLTETVNFRLSSKVSKEYQHEPMDSSTKVIYVTDNGYVDANFEAADDGQGNLTYSQDFLGSGYYAYILPETEEAAPQPDSSSEDSSEESSQPAESSEAASSSSADSSSKASDTNKGTNPATGAAAALGIVTILAAAAIVTAKKH